MREATSKQVDNALRGNCGYGYQIWRDPENGFSFRDMGSQYAICFPDKAFAFTCISDTQGAPSGSHIPDVMLEEIYPHLSATPLPEDEAAQAALAEKISSLTVLPLLGKPDSPIAPEIGGRWYSLEQNPMGITRTRLSFSDDAGTWEYTNAQGDSNVGFGIGRQQAGHSHSAITSAIRSVSSQVKNTTV